MSNKNVISFVAKAVEKGVSLNLPAQEDLTPLETESLPDEAVDVYVFTFADDIVRVEIYRESEYIEVKYYDKETNSKWRHLEMDSMALGMLIHCIKEIAKENTKNADK